MDLARSVQFLARATLEDDGVPIHYKFRNRSDLAYDIIYAVTDPRLTSRLHDVRLERTYVHHADGFDLLASETPNRLSLPLAEWLPSRYLVSYTWPVPTARTERRGDGITYYNKSRAVDEPFITTRGGRSWVVASIARETGNVWSNPELTCQHVNPQVQLAPSGDAVAEIKSFCPPADRSPTFTRAPRRSGSLSSSLDLLRERRPLANLRTVRGVPIASAVNLAVNQTLGRTFITAGATLLSVLALFLFGGEVLRGFAFAILVGIATRTYSTVFVAAPIAARLARK